MKPKLAIVVLMALLFAVPLIFLALSVERAPVCIDPNATIEADRILNCHEWEDQLQIQF